MLSATIEWANQFRNGLPYGSAQICDYYEMIKRFSVAGLFAGIGGVEKGLQAGGGEAVILCENWEPARRVLAARFPEVPLAGDVRNLRSLPDVDVLTAGFPCTDLSLAGRMKGISGPASGLVSEVFRLVRQQRPPVVILENVKNMLTLDGGSAMRCLVDELEDTGYAWAYRLVDSRFTGVPQRRQRVIFVASLTVDPQTVIFADEAGEPGPEWYTDAAFGFYWTEGRRGLGWAQDAVPTLKGGSSIGIPSPPAIWNHTAELGRRVVLPSVEDCEQMQGFPIGWTSPADREGERTGRWKLTGNAVTVGVSTWIGSRLANPGDPVLNGRPLKAGSRWPTAAHGAKGKVWAMDVSMWPTRQPYRHLHDLVCMETAKPLSARASAGFLSRALAGDVRFVDGFLDDIAEHRAFMAAEAAQNAA